MTLTQPLLFLDEVLAIWTPPRKPSSIRIRHFLWQVESHLDPANGYCNGCERDSSFHMTFLCKPKINKLLATSKFHAQIFSNSVKCGFTVSPSAKFAQRPWGKVELRSTSQLISAPEEAVQVTNSCFAREITP